MNPFVVGAVGRSRSPHLLPSAFLSSPSLNIHYFAGEPVYDDTRVKRPRCIVIAGPNGAGKTTFAREFLPREAAVINFVNVDLIASGLSPLNPDIAAVAAGKLLLKEVSRLARARADFAFESTLSGLAYAKRIERWKHAGYRIEIYFIRLASPALALRRIATRVKQGGHVVAQADVLRRFDRSWNNFENIYRPLSDAWFLYDNSEESPTLIEEGP